MPATSKPEVPQFDKYVVTRLLGEGGMGCVYHALERWTGLPYAIKVMSKRLHDPDMRARFLRENQILASLNHRHIVRCWELTESLNGIPALVMEYLEGVDMRAFEGRPYPELIPLMIQTVLGMDYLKTQNIVHRDLSSNNILVTLENNKRIVKILDFGIAKILGEQKTAGMLQTITGQFLGKFAFASPELFQSTNVDWRSDVYSLGVIFHRLVTKRPPIRVEHSNNYFEWMVAHQQPLDLPFEEVPGNPKLPVQLKDLIRRMLAKAPQDRPGAYGEIIEILDFVQTRALDQGLGQERHSSMGLPAAVMDRPVTPPKPEDAFGERRSPGRRPPSREASPIPRQPEGTSPVKEKAGAGGLPSDSAATVPFAASVIGAIQRDVTDVSIQPSFPTFDRKPPAGSLPVEPPEPVKQGGPAGGPAPSRTPPRVKLKPAVRTGLVYGETVSRQGAVNTPGPLPPVQKARLSGLQLTLIVLSILFVFGLLGFLFVRFFLPSIQTGSFFDKQDPRTREAPLLDGVAEPKFTGLLEASA